MIRLRFSLYREDYSINSLRTFWVSGFLGLLVKYRQHCLCHAPQRNHISQVRRPSSSLILLSGEDYITFFTDLPWFALCSIRTVPCLIQCSLNELFSSGLSWSSGTSQSSQASLVADVARADMENWWHCQMLPSTGSMKDSSSLQAGLNTRLPQHALKTAAHCAPWHEKNAEVIKTIAFSADG